jgi:hypothetical protein
MGEWEGNPNPTENQKSSEICLEYNEIFMGYNMNFKEFMELIFKSSKRISVVLQIPIK